MKGKTAFDNVLDRLIESERDRAKNNAERDLYRTEMESARRDTLRLRQSLIGRNDSAEAMHNLLIRLRDSIQSGRGIESDLLQAIDSMIDATAPIFIEEHHGQES